MKRWSTAGECAAYEAGYIEGSADAIEQKKRKKGKWIKNNDSDHAWKCSVCGCGYTDYRLNYCYDCGAEMEGEE